VIANTTTKEARMSEHVDAARRLYQAIAARDAHALLEAMEEEFEGRVSQGMPLGVGGRHEGRERMLHDVWLKVFAAFDTMPQVARFIETGGPELVAVGRYVGSARETGRPVDAAFAHVLSIRGGRVASLEQITDTQR
jgi:2-(1,2-epoxy-1,2-dihydrophenyl)acetyl-CoA isomerase